MPTTPRHRESIDEKVQVDHLSRRLGRYNLVVAVSKRSRDLKERVDSILVPSTGTLIKRALKEVADGKIKVTRPEMQQEELPQLEAGEDVEEEE